MYFTDYNNHMFTFDESVEEELGLFNDLGGKIAGSIIKPLTSIAETAKRVAIGVPPENSFDTSQAESLARQNLLSKVVKRVNNRISPHLSEMDTIVAYGDAQTKATNEHNQKMRKEVFRKEVIKELKYMARYLPSDHPVKTRINSL